jgi:hypothetical protein
MLLLKRTQAEWRSFLAWPPQDLAAHALFMRDLDRELTATGELVSDHRLAGPEHAQVVRARSGNPPQITTAPFPDGRELLARCWVVDCETPARAIAIAAQVSAAPGRDGRPLDLAVEVRQVMTAPGEEM